MQFLKDWHRIHHDLHHAHLIFGERESTVNDLESFFRETLSMSIRGNPDYWKEEFSVFGIDDSRRIATIARRKAFSKEKTIIVLCVDSFTIEAQNSLLKIFEDPVPHVHFFVITHGDSFLVPTLLSRMLVVKAPTEDLRATDIKKGHVFLGSSLKDRLTFIEPLLEEKDKGKVLSFFDDLEEALYEKFGKNPQSYEPVLRDVLKMRGYVMDRSSSLKMLLEHVAHVVSRS